MMSQGLEGKVRPLSAKPRSLKIIIGGVFGASLLSSLTMPAVATTQLAEQENAQEAPSATCLFDTKAENPHVSGLDVSVHGYWIDKSPGCAGIKAVVTTTLESNNGGGWAARAVQQRTLGPGGARASVARTPCVPGDFTAWRAVVDVDLIGLADDPLRQTSAEVSLSCA